MLKKLIRVQKRRKRECLLMVDAYETVDANEAVDPDETVNADEASDTQNARGHYVW